MSEPSLWRRQEWREAGRVLNSVWQRSMQRSETSVSPKDWVWHREGSMVNLLYVFVREDPFAWKTRMPLAKTQNGTHLPCYCFPCIFG